ncbi:uncharacterized protein LOC128800555 [Vidua chalybeata]|uniref:uncharacterized protein LOC128800555 n=1 Tax=Vidua chalybeata TaxID=81927 RepID=UPI0023A81B56|nr:uncharacterized protein LOC128800555 [Vidua chalybeata]XP_053821803.1 uncharacterized protein LOC128800555 [Vidua chalybeata]
MSVSTFLLLVWLQKMTFYLSTGDAWIVPQPWKNVWVTLAQALKQEHLCLATASAENPMSTCLVGIPSKGQEFPKSLIHLQKELNENNPPNIWAEFDKHKDVVECVKIPVQNPLLLWQKFVLDLPAADGEPQELELLGSTKAEFCVQFNFSPDKEIKLYAQVRQYKIELRAGQWCTAVAVLEIPSTTDFYPLKLEKGMFFIRGDRAYPGIPSRLAGGPCMLGRLSLASPNMTQIPIGKTKSETKITKRSANQFDEHCDAEIYHWAKSKRVAVSVFPPWVAAAKALSELGNLECWVTKQASLTSAALRDLLADEEITRKATLQNRAAINFLLLAHGHGCKEFEGLCCFDLSSKGQSVQSSIREMRNLIGSVKQENEDWFKGMFKGWDLSGWVLSLLKDICYVVVAIFLVLLLFGIFKLIISSNASSKFATSAPGIAAATTGGEWWENGKQDDTAV